MTWSMPRCRNSKAAPRPAGPPPTMATVARSGLIIVQRGGEGHWKSSLRELRQLSAAIERLAAAHRRPRAPAQTAEVPRRHRRGERCLDLSPSHELAVADDFPISRHFPIAGQMLSEVWDR